MCNLKPERSRWLTENFVLTSLSIEENMYGLIRWRSLWTASRLKLSPQIFGENSDLNEFNYFSTVVSQENIILWTSNFWFEKGLCRLKKCTSSHTNWERKGLRNYFRRKNPIMETFKKISPGWGKELFCQLAKKFLTIMLRELSMI